jgi:NAD(P)-dependent dehydrogenase (short-subunit alcohol dehydrogenase family)
LIVLITGCRSGFGLRAAVSAAQAGHTVYAGLRDLSTRTELDQASRGLDVHPVQLDVTRADERAAVFRQIVERHGRLDALVNNAGVALGGYLEEVSEAEVRTVFEVNVLAVWALTQLVLPGMRVRGLGHIINISSVSGRIAMPGLGVYASSKFALEGMSEALRHEVAPFGVQVTLVEPGPYRTDMTTGARRSLVASVSSSDSPYAAYSARSVELFERVSGSLGNPQDVADRIVAILGRTRPRLRHPMGASAYARLTLRWWLPFGWWQLLVGWLTRPRS